MMKYDIIDIEDDKNNIIFLLKDVEIEDEDNEILNYFRIDLNNNFYDNNNEILDLLTLIKILHKNNIFKIYDEDVEIDLKDVNKRLINIFFEDINDKKHNKFFKELLKIVDLNDDRLIYIYRLFDLIYSYILLYQYDLIDLYVDNVYEKKVIIQS